MQSKTVSYLIGFGLLFKLSSNLCDEPPYNIYYMGSIKSISGHMQSGILHSSLFSSLLMACHPAVSQNNTDQDSIKFYTTQLLNGIATGDTSALVGIS
jgi:hypothetical protein